MDSRELDFSWRPAPERRGHRCSADKGTFGAQLRAGLDLEVVANLLLMERRWLYRIRLLKPLILVLNL
jgi:hypothetical protein